MRAGKRGLKRDKIRQVYISVDVQVSIMATEHNHIVSGGGVKGGQVIGVTDEVGMHAIEDLVHVNDVHATILHLVGLDHERVTYYHNGRDQRLTNVAGNVVEKVFT